MIKDRIKKIYVTLYQNDDWWRPIRCSIECPDIILSWSTVQSGYSTDDLKAGYYSIHNDVFYIFEGSGSSGSGRYPGEVLFSCPMSELIFVNHIPDKQTHYGGNPF